MPMKMLIHVCCGDCALKFVDAVNHDEKLKDSELYLYFYNPNIHPHSEFTARQVALQKIASENKLNLIIANWTPKDYFQELQKFEKAKRFDSSLRCPYCWTVRLTKTFTYAKENGFEAVSSTLLTSKYMHKDTIIHIASELAKKYSINFYEPKEINCELHTAGFYKQNYCGCVYSLLERMSEKYIEA